LDALVIGVVQDEYFTTFGSGETPGAENLISSAMKRVDNGVYDMVEALVNGESFSADSLYVLTVENGGIDFAPPHDADVPEDVTAQVAAIKDGLADGSIETGVDPVTGNIIGSDATPEPMATAEPTAEATEASS
jgi:basic membrane lipoprotein Med (substrate-binding protein (PBP1-ABC) superfamily)